MQVSASGFPRVQVLPRSCLSLDLAWRRGAWTGLGETQGLQHFPSPHQAHPAALQVLFMLFHHPLFCGNSCASVANPYLAMELQIQRCTCELAQSDTAPAGHQPTCT